MRGHHFATKQMASIWNRHGGTDNFSPINKASELGFLEIVEYILTFEGINLTISYDNHNEITPLHSACFHKRWKVAKTLMAYPHMSKEEKTKLVSLRGRYRSVEKRTAIETAREKGNDDIALVSYLLFVFHPYSPQLFLCFFSQFLETFLKE